MGAALVVGGSVGEDLNTSLNRVRGTVAGALVGAAFAIVLGKTIWSLGIAVAVLAWLSVGLGWGVAAMRVGIPMTLVVLFTHDGRRRALRCVASAEYADGRRDWHCGKPLRMADSWRDEVAAAIDRALSATTAALDALAQRRVVRRAAAAAGAVARYAYRR